MALAEAAAAEAEALDLYPLSTQALTVLAMALAFGGDVDGERRAHEAKLAMVRAKGDLARTADVLNTLAEIALDDGDGEGAHAFAVEALGDRRSNACRPWRATPRSRWRALPSSEAMSPMAARRLAEALDQSDRLGQTLAVAQCLRVGGCLAAARGEADTAVGCSRRRRRLSPSPGGGDVPPEQDLAAALAEARTLAGRTGCPARLDAGLRACPSPRSAAQLTLSSCSAGSARPA